LFCPDGNVMHGPTGWGEELSFTSDLNAQRCSIEPSGRRVSSHDPRYARLRVFEGCHYLSCKELKLASEIWKAVEALARPALNKVGIH
jgi:hypothetical protein